jgi:hypothetical protein
MAELVAATSFGAIVAAQFFAVLFAHQYRNVVLTQDAFDRRAFAR